MVQRIEFEISERLRKEIEAISCMADESAISSEIRTRFPDAKALEQFIRTNPFYIDLVRSFAQAKDQRRVLDVGVGGGETSVYLALLGYEVVAVEPVYTSCQHAELLAAHCSVPMHVVNTTAEHMDALDRTFDCVVFHSSLHHCDDPIRALRNAHSLLVPGGSIHLLCEPILHAFRSKASFYRALETAPESVDHYGGNEHIYRSAEYVDMLKAAGFRQVRVQLSPMLLIEPRFATKTSLAKRVAVRCFYMAMRTVVQAGLVGCVQPLADRLSLGPRMFTACK
jgi:2-polyprenyl-3-methyl-5-hydroxy-6-metoxy-1,4-benzoquinol methylase